MPIDNNSLESINNKRVFEHRALRLGVGITVVFLIAMPLQWTFAYLAPIFFPLLIQSGRPLRAAEAVKLIIALFLVMTCTYFLSGISRQLPLLFALMLIPMLYLTFRALFNGGSVLIILMILVGLVLTPMTAKVTLDVAWDVSTSFVWNISLCIAISYIMFALFPPLLGEPEPNPRPKFPPKEAEWRAAMLAIIVGSYELAFLSFDWYNAHTPLYIAVFASTLAFSKTSKIAKGILIANVIGGTVAIIMYELIAAVPIFIFLAALTLPIMIIFARGVVSSAPWAPLASFAMSVVLLILGSSIGPTDTNTGFESISYRLFELIIAALYAIAVTFILQAFSITPPSESSET